MRIMHMHKHSGFFGGNSKEGLERFLNGYFDFSSAIVTAAVVVAVVAAAATEFVELLADLLDF